MKKIIILGLTNEILGEFAGVWSKGVWDKIEKEVELGVEFEWWGKEDEEGDGWEMYGYDGLGVLLCDVDKDERKCMKEYINLVKRKY